MATLAFYLVLQGLQQILLQLSLTLFPRCLISHGQKEDAHQVFVKMPHKCLIIEASKPTTPRRSLRLLQLNNTPTRNPCSKLHPISDFYPTFSPKSRSKYKKNALGGFPGNLSNDSIESRSSPRTCKKSARIASRFGTVLDSNVLYSTRSKGRGICPGKTSKCVKNSNGGSMDRENFDGLEGLRRSPRFCNKVNSTVNGKMRQLMASPTIPVGMGEKKLRCSDIFKPSMSKSPKKIVVHSGSDDIRDTSQSKGGFPGNFSNDSNESKSAPRTCKPSARRASKFGTDLDSNVLYFTRSKGRDICPRKSSKCVQGSDGGSMNSEKSTTNSTENSMSKANSDEPERLRRCPRFCNKVSSTVNEKRLHLKASPFTPVRVEEKKLKCSDKFKPSTSKSEKGIVVYSGSDDVSETNQIKRKKVENDYHAVTVCGLPSISVSFSCIPGGLQGREQKLKASDQMKSKVGYSCESNVQNPDRIITRSASKHKGRQDDLCRNQIVEKQSDRTSARIVARKAASSVTLEEKRRGCGSLTPLLGQAQEQTARSLVVSPSISPEEECSDVLPICRDPARVENKTQTITNETKLIGNKRKRKQAELLGPDKGWTKELEAALQRAYFTAKPSPHFWKRVAKLVPGKSAQECFDKVHSSNLTPLSTRPKRAKKCNSPSDVPVSGCKLFKPAGTKKSRRTKQKSHIAHRTVRHLLQKYCQVNKDNEADLFSILEPTVNPSAEVLQLSVMHSTPERVLKSPGSSSGHKKCRSRVGSASKSPLTSPPVLKMVKNMAQHEKYIDQLHKREAKRKVKFAGRGTLDSCQKIREENLVAIKNATRAAKDALVSDARDVISKFRDSQIMDTFSDSEEEARTIEDEDDGILV